MKKTFLYWLSRKCRDWSYDLCDLSRQLESRAEGPRKPWVPKGPIEEGLHRALVAHYKDQLANPTFLIDKIDKAKRFEDVTKFRYTDAGVKWE